MINIDEIHSDVTVGSAGPNPSDSFEESEGIMIDELRELVRQILVEEYERVIRVSVTDNGWSR